MDTSINLKQPRSCNLKFLHPDPIRPRYLRDGSSSRKTCQNRLTTSNETSPTNLFNSCPSSCFFWTFVTMLPTETRKWEKTIFQIELKDYVVLHRGQDNCLPSPLLILDFTIRNDRFGWSHLYPTGQFTHKTIWWSSLTTWWSKGHKTEILHWISVYVLVPFK